MRNLIDLENLDGLPAQFKKALMHCDCHFLRHQYFEEIRDKPSIQEIIEQINNYCIQNMVVGYHFTRAIPEDLLKLGLLPRSGSDIRDGFIKRFGNRFTAGQLDAIKSQWTKCYDKKMQNCRDNRIYFNFTKYALGKSGSELLLKNYGGEQVYFYIDKIPGVGEVLESIGEPLLVRCALIPNEVKTFLTQPWGEIAVSSYHRIVNPNAHQVDQDGYQLSSVHPERIELIKIN